MVRRFGVTLAFAAFLGATSDSVLAATPASPQAAEIAPSLRGNVGAWLVAGPFRASKPALDSAPEGVDETALAPSSGATVGGPREFDGKKRPAATWQLASSNEGPIDLKAALEATSPDLVGYAAGTLRVQRAGRYLLLLGVDDGVRVSVDGKVVYRRDDARALHDDDDIVPLDLTSGDHPVMLKFHQRDGAWAFHARIVDESLEAPAGVSLALPNVSANEVRDLAGKMSWISFDRPFDTKATPARYRPTVTIRYLEGAPRGVQLTVGVKLATSGSTAEPSDEVFDLRAGVVPITSSVGELVVKLPTVAPFRSALGFEATVVDRVSRATFVPRPASEHALARAERVLATVLPDAPWLSEGSLDSVRYAVRRLAHFVARGDLDDSAQAEEARELELSLAALERNEDPYAGRSGPMRRALRSPVDDDLSELGVYVPPSHRRGTPRTYPLIVALHGMNGGSMSILRYLFGNDDPKHDQVWEDRHFGTLPSAETFVVAPMGHGNTMYRELGEGDIQRATAWAMRMFPIDPSRVTITGPSMGGIGSASVPFHFPHRFAAAMPLCGYHSYFVRRDIAGRPMRPWEKFLAEERSNALWAENGEHLPLFIVHGTKDLPEENSGVLIDRYEKLHYSVKHEHPELGHNVWQTTYEESKGIDWLVRNRLDLHPSHVRFRTTRTRWATSAWVTVDELATEANWGDVDARRDSKRRISLKASGISAMSLARDATLFSTTESITVVADGTSLTFEATEPITIQRDPRGHWQKQERAPAPGMKRSTMTGPLRDVFNEPTLFVYGSHGVEARANEEVARAYARIRPGVKVSYPILSDEDFLARKEPLANDRALFLVGRENRVLEAFGKVGTLPIHVGAGFVTVGSERITGKELGAAFIVPNPARADRYLVVMAGADVTGMIRALSLPDLLPDFVVWDEAVAPARGQLILGAASLRAGGFFKKDWSLPPVFSDPLVRMTRPSPKTEHEATPYLP